METEYMKTAPWADLSKPTENWTVNRKLINILWRATLARYADGARLTGGPALPPIYTPSRCRATTQRRAYEIILI